MVVWGRVVVLYGKVKGGLSNDVIEKILHKKKKTDTGDSGSICTRDSLHYLRHVTQSLGNLSC